MNQIEIRNWIIRVVKRMALEFCIPAVAAILWYYLADNSTLHGAGLFFISISWITAQLFRIIKQQRVEGEFNLVKSQLGDLVNKLQEQTNKIVGHVTGGDCHPFLYPIGNFNSTGIKLFMINENEFICQDISLEIYEIDNDNGNIHKLFYDKSETVSPTVWYLLKYIIPEFKGEKKFRVCFQNKAGKVFNQFILVKTIEDNYLIAYSKLVNGKIEYVVPDNFSNEENPSVLFKDLRKSWTEIDESLTIKISRRKISS